MSGDRATWVADASGATESSALLRGRNRKALGVHKKLHIPLETALQFRQRPWTGVTIDLLTENLPLPYRARQNAHMVV